MGEGAHIKKVLIIDDEQDIRDSLTAVLCSRGYETCIAKDGEEGLTKMREFEPHIVFCDIVMPKINGLEFLETIRRRGSKAQVIMITGQMFMLHNDEIIKQGICGYLLKPLQVETILAHIAIAEANIKADT